MKFLKTCKIIFIASLTIFAIPIASIANNDIQSNTPEDKSIHLKGEINIDGKPMPIFMHLTDRLSANNYQGFYYFLKDLRPRTLKDEYSPNKNIFLALSEDNALIGLTFKDNKASGTWTSKADKRTGKISLEALKEPDTNRLILIPPYKPGPTLDSVSIELEQKNGALGSAVAVLPRGNSNTKPTQKIMSYEGKEIFEVGRFQNDIDFNSDGIKDLSFQSFEDKLWIFDSKSSQFKMLEFGRKICNPRPDPKKKELTIYCTTGIAGLEYSSARFAFNEEKLILIEEEDGQLTGKKDEAVFHLKKATTVGSPIVDICDCLYSTTNSVIKKCRVKKDKCEKSYNEIDGD